MDHADAAQEPIELERMLAEKLARGRSGPETHPDFDGENCVDCGAGVPPARLAMGKVRCVDCQTRIEDNRANAQIRIVT